jgi:hypothetical protein
LLDDEGEDAGDAADEPLLRDAEPEAADELAAKPFPSTATTSSAAMNITTVVVATVRRILLRRCRCGVVMPPTSPPGMRPV